MLSIECFIRKHNTLFRLSKIVIKCGYCIAPKSMVRIVYRLRIGRWPNLANPQTFTEKIQWIRLHDRDPLKGKLADKYLVRDWIADKIGQEYLIPLLGVWDAVEDIDFEELPNQFVLKANHRSNMNIIVRNKDELNLEETRRACRKWLKTNYGKENYELQYANIPRKILAEKYIENDGGNLNDYKIYCFGGKAYYIQYISDRKDHKTHEAFYDREWNLMPFGAGNYPKYNTVIKKPANLVDILKLAETLAADFPFVRIDLYHLDTGKILFGEMTFTPAAGIQQWSPKEWDEKLGKLYLINHNIADICAEKIRSIDKGLTLPCQNL